MNTLMKIGEFFANPLVSGILLTVFILPVFWGLLKLLEWIREIDNKGMKKYFEKED